MSKTEIGQRTMRKTEIETETMSKTGTHQNARMNKSLLLIICVVGIYSCFLTWGILQEKITTVQYGAKVDSKFKFFIFLNFCQALIALSISYIFLALKRIGVGPISRPLIKEYAQISVCSVLASPFGYESLKYINYPTMILGKSCKLLPVMLMNWILAKKRFETYKYVTVFLITVGVTGFMFFEPAHPSRQQTNQNASVPPKINSPQSELTSHQPTKPTTQPLPLNTTWTDPDSMARFLKGIWGLSLLMVNLMLDGVMNSLEDRAFAKYGINSFQMMFWMNTFGSLFSALWLLNPWNSELVSALAFIWTYPSVLYDVLIFGFCGALGQCFVFLTLEKFGSLTLVTVTVTRKVVTVLLSIFLFNHQMNLIQWPFVLTVFAGLLLETRYKHRPHSN